MNSISKYDIACLTETFLSDHLERDTFKGFTSYSSLAKKKLSHHGRYSGGVTVLVRNDWSRFVNKIDVDSENTVVLLIDKDLLGGEKDLLLISVYIPPCDSNYWNTSQNGFGIESLENTILDLSNVYVNSLVVICGDLNARTADKNIDFSLSEDMDQECMDYYCEALKRSSHDSLVNEFGEQLLELCNVYDMMILNGLTRWNYDDSATYFSENGHSVLDYYLLSLDGLSILPQIKLEVNDMIDSDHLPVSLVINFDQIKATNSEQVSNKETVTRTIWQKDKVSEFRDNFISLDCKTMLDKATEEIDSNIDTALQTFNECLKTAANCMQKQIKQPNSRSNAPWFDEECKKARKECRKKLKTLKKNMKRSKTSCEESRVEFVKSRKGYKKLIRLKKQANQKSKAESLENNLHNPSTFWKEVKNLGGCNCKTIENKLKIEDWYKHFQNVFKECDDTTSGDFENHCEGSISEDSDHILNAKITEEEVRQAIHNLNNGKAGGTDGIIPEMLKTGGEEVICFLTKLYNKVFDCGIYPQEWAKAIVVPVFKKGDPDKPDNYRGISLINTTCKCYTAILNKRLYTWLEDRNIIVENQAGFRRNYSTVDQIFNLYSVIQKLLNKKGQKIYVAFVDFKKAFDSVNHKRLLEIVYGEGIRGKFFICLKAMYDSLVSCVRANNNVSEFFDCPVGVRQGCVMSPTLFSLFINQLANHINESGVHGIQILPNLLELFILLFADDVALISTTPRGLQAQLNILKECCDNLKLIVNRDKTKVMVFRKGGYLGGQEKWFFDGNMLEVVNNYCYLGFTFTTKLSFNLGTKHLVAKGKKALYLILRAFHNCKEMSHKCFFRIFDSKIQSILLYSSEVWGYQRLDKLEKVHLLACKRFLGVPIKTPNKIVYGELGRFPLYINSTIRCIKYWLRLLQMDPHRLPKQAYQMMVMQDQSGKICWATHIRELLSRTGFYYIWHNQCPGNVNGFLKEFRQRLIDQFISEWDSSIRNKERYALYSTVKDSFGCSAYIDNISIYCFRVAFSQIRAGVIPINSNLKRYSPNPNDLFCPFCCNTIENERHFLFECTTYSDLRQIFLQGISHDQIHKVLQGEGIHSARSIAKYVFHSIRRRQKILDSH